MSLENNKKKKKFTLTKYASFTEEVYANSEEEANEQFEKIFKSFISKGDMKTAHTEVEKIQCPRCQTPVKRIEKSSECEECGLEFSSSSNKE